jgi:lysophospholipase L1-like esterase
VEVAVAAGRAPAVQSRPPMARLSLRRLAARTLLLAAGLALGLAAAELAVRLLRPQPVMVVSRGLYQADPPRRYRLAPGFRGRLTNRVEFDTRVETDAAGLRGPEAGPRRPGVLRVLALGDSFTFGVGVEQAEAWPARLAAHLAAAGQPAQALNAGAPGFGVPDEVAWLAKWGLPLDPDVVAIAVFVGNDLQDAAPDVPKVEVVDGALVLQGEGKPSLGRWLYYHSHLFVLLKSGLPAGVGRRLRAALGRPEPWEVRELRLEFDLYGEKLPPSLRAGAAATERAVGELARLARSRRFRPVALLIPSEPQVDPAAWRQVLARLGLDPAGYDPGRPTRLFAGMFERAGVPVLDLTRPLADAVARGERVYYPIDKHLTAAGQDLVARQAAAFLRALEPTAPAARP